MNDGSGCAFFCFALLFSIIGAVIANEVRDKYPQALDVYRGNTELEITSVNGIPTDTVVVFKSEKKHDYE